MANYIDFDADVKRYYSETYRKNNPYADLLAPLIRTYGGANQQVSDEVTRLQNQSRVQNQRSVADIYASFERGKRALGGAGFSSSFTQGMTKTLSSGASESYGEQTRTGEANLPQGQYYDITQNPLYQSYVKETGRDITATSQLTKAMFSYLNQDESMTDTQYAMSQGYITEDGEITEKGRIAMEYYGGKIGVDLEHEKDELLLGKGTFSTYFRDEMGDDYNEDVYNKAFGTLSEMVGSTGGLGNPYENKLTSKEIGEMFKGSVTYAKENTDFSDSGKYRTIKEKNYPDMSQKVKSENGQEYTIAEMIKFGFAEGMKATDRKGRNVYYHNGEWYLDKKDRRD